MPWVLVVGDATVSPVYNGTGHAKINIGGVKEKMKELVALTVVGNFAKLSGVTFLGHNKDITYEMVAEGGRLIGFVKSHDAKEYEMTIGACKLKGNKDPSSDQRVVVLTPSPGALADMELHSDLAVLDATSEAAKKLKALREAQDEEWARRKYEILSKTEKDSKVDVEQYRILEERLATQLKELEESKKKSEAQQGKLGDILGKKVVNVKRKRAEVQAVGDALTTYVKNLLTNAAKVRTYLIAETATNAATLGTAKNAVRATQRKLFKDLKKQWNSARGRSVDSRAVLELELGDLAQVLKPVKVSFVKVSGAAYDGYMDPKTKTVQHAKEGDWIAIVDFHDEKIKLAANGIESSVEIPPNDDLVKVWEINADGAFVKSRQTVDGILIDTANSTNECWQRAHQAVKDPFSMQPEKVNDMLRRERVQRIQRKHNAANASLVSTDWNSEHANVEQDETVTPQEDTPRSGPWLIDYQNSISAIMDVPTVDSFEKLVDYLGTVPEEATTPPTSRYAQTTHRKLLEIAINNRKVFDHQLADVMEEWRKFSDGVALGKYSEKLTLFPDIRMYGTRTITDKVRECAAIENILEASKYLTNNQCKASAATEEKSSTITKWDHGELQVLENHSLTEEQRYHRGGALVVYMGCREESVSFAVAQGFTMLPLAFKIEGDQKKEENTGYAIRLHLSKSGDRTVVITRDGASVNLEFRVTPGTVTVLKYNASSKTIQTDDVDNDMKSRLLDKAFEMRDAFYPAVGVS
eukprot:GHVS01100967.1.p1 GENE.GHVS01100967.1~~GHVS01100967.1.p1  ORF type:complete len:753 (+),score=79.26 GHVS01100967.1:850-3108(+)